MVTQLSIIAVPGRTYSFAPKDPSIPVVPSDPITALSTIATPGRRYNFVAKDPAVVIVTPGGGGRRIRERDELDERDIRDIITILRMTGIML